MMLLYIVGTLMVLWFACIAAMLYHNTRRDWSKMEDAGDPPEIVMFMAAIFLAIAVTVLVHMIQA